MPRCGPFIGEKPRIWKDDGGWNCNQVAKCLKCGDIDFSLLAEDATFKEALDSVTSSNAFPRTCSHPRAVATRVVGEMGYWTCPDCGHKSEMERLDD